MRKVVIAVGLALSLLLGGCAALPTTGEVHLVEPRDIPAPNVQVQLQGPLGEEEPIEIVNGFLEATRFGSAPFEYARRFLTEDAARSWDPDSIVYVYAGANQPTTEQEADGRISVSVKPVARIDEQGHYTPMEDAEMTVDFSLVADAEGNWRIGALDDGVMISDLTFNQSYVAAPLQFISDDDAALVPDMRWFPKADAVEAVVQGLLDGPSQWLTHAVKSAFPEGTTIGPEGVQATDGAVKVDLSATAASIRPADVPLMMTQLYQSLVALTDVTVVDVTVAGQTLVGADGPAREFALPQPVTTPYLLAGTSLARWIGTELEIVDDSEEFAASAPRDPAVPYAESGAPIVYIAGENELRTVATESAESRVLLEGANLVAPSYDRESWIWTTPRVSDGTLLAVSEAGEVRPVSVSWLDGVTVSSVRVSPGGDRVAIVRSVDDVDQLVVAVVRRDTSGTPLSLGDPFEIAPGLTEIVDVTWVDQINIGVLGSQTGGQRFPYLAYMGGPVRQRPQVVGADSLTSMRSERSMLIATEEGTLWQRTAVNWQAVYSGVSDPAYSG